MLLTYFEEVEAIYSDALAQSFRGQVYQRMASFRERLELYLKGTLGRHGIALYAHMIA